uniref:AbiTii domain-containing protein n=1 Tax=Trichocoleus desertorum TaxID=1481672 RepID=UPI0025B4A4AE|nr:hypothetical protein [Trichocoleus desertorum]
MNSLVLELQRDALDPSSSVLFLLRKALVIAKKLSIQEFQEWAALELSGYSDGSRLPQYRFVEGQVKARNPYHGWVPVMLSSDLDEFLSSCPMHQPISEIQSLAIRDGSTVLIFLSKEMEALLMQGMNVPLQPAIHVDRSQIHGILEAVRDIVLNWSIKLEQDGILEEGMTFSREERRVAANATYNIQKFIGAIHHGGISMTSDHSTNVQAGRDANGNMIGSDISGVVAGGNISGVVTNTIHQLRELNTSESTELADKLVQLQAAIENEPSLKPEDKAEALEQINVLAEAGKNPKTGVIQKMTGTAVKIIRGTVASLPVSVKLVEETNKLLPEIAKLLHYFG